MLTEVDLATLRHALGVARDDISNTRPHSLTGEPIRQAIPNKDGYCSFLTTEHRCRIYQYRPLDCRLYPLDIRWENGKWYWMVYVWEECPLSGFDSFEGAMIRAEREIIPLFTVEELRLYATDDNAAPPTNKTVRLREIRTPMNKPLGY